MELIYKTAAVALSAAIISIVLKKYNPELSTALTLCAIAVILLASLGFVKEIQTLFSAAKRLTETSDIYVVSIFKCLAISIVTKLSSDLCKDANQSALASSVEFSGTICAMCVILPLVNNMLKLVGEMV